MIHKIEDHLWYMGIALEQAEIAYKLGEVPVGAIVVGPTGEILSKTHNLKEKNFNPIGHAEILSLIQSAEYLRNWRLTDCSIYVTLEPCTMCLAAMIQSRIGQCIFGAYDSKGGSLSLGYNFNFDKRLNHRFSLTGGIKHYECSKILSQFFKERRTSYS